MKKDELIMKCRTLDELIDVEYGKVGTPEREKFDKETQSFCLSETLKEERLIEIMESMPIPLFASYLAEDGNEDIKAVLKDYARRIKTQ